MQRLLTDREAMFSRAADEIRAAEEKVSKAEERARIAEDAISDAEQRAQAAEEAARAAERRSTEAEEEVARLRDDLEQVRQRLEAAGRAQASTENGGSPGEGSASGLRSVLEATQDAVARLIEGARRESEESLKDAERRRALVQGEIEQLSTWWGRIQPLVTDVRASIDQAREQVASLQDRIGGAFQPVTSAFGALGGRLEALAEMAATPVGVPADGDHPSGAAEDGPAEAAADDGAASERSTEEDDAPASAVPAAEDDGAPSVVIEVDDAEVAVSADRDEPRADRSPIGRGRRSSWR